MISKVADIIDKNYDISSDCIIYGDTDSVARDSIITINGENKSIEEWFNIFASQYGVYVENDKSFTKISSDSNLTPIYEDENNNIKEERILSLYKHRVTKRVFKITLSTGNTISVTEDHSLFVRRNGKLIVIKPTELKQDDIFIVNSYADT